MKPWELFKKSFRLKADFGYVFLLDLLFYVITVPVLYLSLFLIQIKANQIDVAALQTAMTSTAQTAEQMQTVLYDLKSFVMVMIFSAVLFFVIALFSYSFSRLLIWNYLLKKKLRCVKYLKFVVLNLMLIIPAGVIFAIPFFLMKVHYSAGIILMYIVMVMLAYFVFMVYMEYAETSRIFSSIGNAFKKINKRTFVSYALCLLVYFVIFGIYAAISWYGRLGAMFSLSVYIILLLLFFAWMRLYIKKVQS
ncbi:hypothetical protein KY317_01265 [Candidatus Woesearchaeota archaeon]|nr:hypothetical protein [Candidatus Woesearchaeota archaeon]